VPARTFSWLLVSFGAALLPRSAFGDPASAPATAVTASPAGENGYSAETKARARAIYEKGARAYDEGRYYDAADYFLDTNRIYPRPQLAFNIGRAYDKIGNLAGALRHYREYLRRVPDAPDRVEVSARVRELEHALSERGVQQLSVLSAPDGATVLLDGRPVGVTPWTGETWPGRHRLRLTLAGYRPTEGIVEIDLHRAADAQIALSREPPPAARAQVSAAERELGSRVRPLTWIALGLGTAAFGAALAIEMADREDSGISRTSAFFGGMGVAGSTLGGVLLYFDMNDVRR
jgi:tetratricopeptide (TPR) repeat protein